MGFEVFHNPIGAFRRKADYNNGDTFATIIDALKKEGYENPQYKVLNAMEYGNSPQNRERIYIVAFKDDGIRKKFTFPGAVNLTTKLSDIIDFKKKIDDKYYYTSGKYKGDIYDQLKAEMDTQETVFQWSRHYVRRNKSNVVPTLTANGEGGHNVPIVLTDHGIRKHTPHECFNAQGFPKEFKLPDNMAESRLYKQAGNSVSVSVIARIATNIEKALKA